ncbi:MAG: hypothetical protein NTY45_00190, partial [Elusimicrobia bacterium]|nr:hypothetical protein [Elusimicrobiota bacterium]
HPHPGPQPEPWYPPTPEPYNPQPPAPEYKELSLQSSGYVGRSFYLTFADAKAAYYKGAQLDLTVEAMALPAGADMPANGLQQITVHGTYDVNSMYSIRLADNPPPGRYILTIKFARLSQGSVGAENSTIELLDIK